MIEKNKENKIINVVVSSIKNNFKIISALLVFIFIIFIFSQYYLYQKKNNVLKISLLYDQAKFNINSTDFEKKMNIISKEKGIFGKIASMELIKKSINEKNYDYAYNEYLVLLKSKYPENIYISIIAIHGSYNLIDYISSDKVIKLLSYVDESYVSLAGYKNELQYLLTIKSSDANNREKLFKMILTNENISSEIKERVRKVNELEKYK